MIKKITIRSLKLIALLFLFILFFPVKLSVINYTEKLSKYREKYKEAYFIEATTATGGFWCASAYENHMNEDKFFQVFKGKDFEKATPITLTGRMNNYEAGLLTQNRYIIGGFSYDYIPQVPSYGFLIKKWDIVYPIERKPDLYGIIAPRSYLTLWDFIYKNGEYNSHD